jgi:RNA-dependent RNA polymerase
LPRATIFSRAPHPFHSGALYLNRQDIVLLESRDVPDTNFLLLQNREHQFLIRSLLTVSVAYELLQQKLLPVFKLRQIARHVNIVEEQFFVKLIITCAFNVIRELLDRTRIRIPVGNARNMFGIVDEYRVLEYGQVFVQYSTMHEEKLFPKGEVPFYRLEDDLDSDRPPPAECKILRGRVVITKNPCHHPGDLRVFEAIDVPQLRHLKDVVVFPQKGHRPHSNEISGSDLDGSFWIHRASLVPLSSF